MHARVGASYLPDCLHLKVCIALLVLVVRACFPRASQPMQTGQQFPTSPKYRHQDANIQHHACGHCVPLPSIYACLYVCELFPVGAIAMFH